VYVWLSVVVLDKLETECLVMIERVVVWVVLWAR
jgi:hypothetical protein